MNEAKLTTLEHLRQCLTGTAAVVFKAGADDMRYAYIADVLRRFQYAGLKRGEKGIVLRYLERTAGYSRQPLTRWVNRYQTLRQLKKHYRSPKVGFARIYTEADVALLAETDALHSTAQHLVRPGDLYLDAAGGGGVWRRALRTLGGPLGGASL